MTAAVYPVRRTGTTSVINVLIKARNANDEFSLGQSLSDNNPETSARDSRAPDGIRLVDGKHKKAYLAATTTDGTCLCSPTGGLVPQRENQWWVSVTFAAPPTDVTTVDVTIPTLGTVTDVPVV